MNLADLDQVEQVVLVGLVKAIVHADEQVSHDEGQIIRALANSVGKETWNRRVQEASARFTNADDLFNMARTIERPAARELIHSVLRALAESDEIIAAEVQILDWIAEVWQLGGSAGLLPIEDEDESDSDTFDDDFVLFDDDEAEVEAEEE